TMTATRSDYDPTRFREVFQASYTYANGFARNTHRFADRPALREPDSGRTSAVGWSPLTTTAWAN
ncbi:hypothetical protein IAE22_28480, partial [Bacillus sp. S34]|nr:hypothetical protein [Bacillus sp. S34]